MRNIKNEDKMTIEEARLVANEANKIYTGDTLELIETLNDYIDELEEKIYKLSNKK